MNQASIRHLKIVAAITTVLVSLLAAACTNSAASNSPVEPAATTAPTYMPNPTATPAPTATRAPIVTAVPTPTPDPMQPLLIEAEQIALEYNTLAAQLFDDPRNMDLTRMIALEAGPEPRQPMTDWALRALANLLADNRRRPADDVRYEVIGSQWDPEHIGALAWIDICTQTGPFWYDIDTNEVVREARTDAFVKRVRVLTESMQVAALSEDASGGAGGPCQFSDVDQ